MVQELRVHEAPKERTFEEKRELWMDLVFDEIPLPQEYQEELLEQYAHLRTPQTLDERVRMEWDAYLLSCGDLSEDGRSPRERLREYFS